MLLASVVTWSRVWVQVGNVPSLSAKGLGAAALAVLGAAGTPIGRAYPAWSAATAGAIFDDDASLPGRGGIGCCGLGYGTREEELKPKYYLCLVHGGNVWSG